MKITRSSRTSLKFLPEKKRQELYTVMDEYSKVVTIFIDLFWENAFTKKDLTKEITNIPESWLSARMRQNAAREALGMVGMDVGIKHLIATSHRELRGDDIKEQINKIKQKRQGSKRYKAAKKTLSYSLPKIVKDYFEQHQDLRLVVVERLKNLKQGKNRKRGKSFRKTLNNWNDRGLLKIIEMRCEENRVSFRSVNPYKTSQTCPVRACSHVERENRSGENFKCLRCGYEDHADIVGALNILERFFSGRYGAAFKAA